jgi:hypothetical protein
VLRGWQCDANFRKVFNRWLADAPYAAFRWETPPLTDAALERPVEFVLLDSPWLACEPDRRPFAEHFRQAEQDILVFPNLGGDALLIVPRPLSRSSAYAHLATFVRQAPAAQRDRLWRVTGETMLARVSTRPLWLSTAGGGVNWLHVRLDDRPKYYAYLPYRQLCGSRPAGR